MFCSRSGSRSISVMPTNCGECGQNLHFRYSVCTASLEEAHIAHYCTQLTLYQSPTLSLCYLVMTARVHPTSLLNSLSWLCIM